MASFMNSPIPLNTNVVGTKKSNVGIYEFIGYITEYNFLAMLSISSWEWSEGGFKQELLASR